MLWTSDEGWLWVFTTIEHWKAELLGRHVCMRGERMAAYEPVDRTVKRIFGYAGADAARSVELRHDHGNQYLTDYFHGSPLPCFALVGEPETNGAVERSNRYLS